MLTTDCKFLENELMDVARLFKRRPESVRHTFRFAEGVFYNTFWVDGEEHRFEEKGMAEDEVTYKRLERRFAKLALYDVLSERFGEKMPWGALTGIRPTKLAYRELSEGRDFQPLFEKMRVSEENISVIRRILKAQEGIYAIDEQATDLFVSLPFCPSKCAYCSFITAPIEKTRGFLPAYLAALKKELAASEELIGDLKSVYIGGGTPFALSAEELKEVLLAVAPLRKNDCEYTVEAGRPDVFSEEKLQLLKEFGVTRICINPQTFSDETLKKIGRKHTVADVYKAFELSQKYGFLINLDLIAGLEGERTEDFVSGVKKAVETGAENVTVHCLSLKSGAKLKEETEYLENDFVSDMVAASREILTAAGYEPYYLYRQKYQVGNNENVGWAKAGKECIYNVNMMEEITNNLAVGANAVSKKIEAGGEKISRFGSPKDLKTYLEKIEQIIENKRKFFKESPSN
ncbi:MAG: coproporphyrinogen dehydrogenase HemZ [Clostridia bacterium]|nr:coproporphyrinogen dehydrogenase HemZ [Clostridia bacterium]